jgi:hypothetical protein
MEVRGNFMLRRSLRRLKSRSEDNIKMDIINNNVVGIGGRWD